MCASQTARTCVSDHPVICRKFIALCSCHYSSAEEHSHPPRSSLLPACSWSLSPLPAPGSHREHFLCVATLLLTAFFRIGYHHSLRFPGEDSETVGAHGEWTQTWALLAATHRSTHLHPPKGLWEHGQLHLRGPHVLNLGWGLKVSSSNKFPLMLMVRGPCFESRWSPQSQALWEMFLWWFYCVCLLPVVLSISDKQIG